MKTPLIIRRAGPADGGQLARLAALDSAPVPDGPAVLAESEGRLLAAVPIGHGRPIADPFEPTSDVVAALELLATLELRLREIEVGRRGVIGAR